jgi:hypothetical protein
MADRLAKAKGVSPSLHVVVDSPELERVPGRWQALERVLVQAFVAQPADHALDESVLHGLAGRNVVPGHATPRSACQPSIACEVSSVPLVVTI